MVINPYNVCAISIVKRISSTIYQKHAFPKEHSLEGSRIILDCSHGATYRVAPETFAELGAEVTTLFDTPNGRNINLNCGSQHPGVLAEEVLKTQADVGFAFDGDGDRLIAVDEKGQVLTGDQILAVCAGVMKKEGLLTNNLVVRTVMSNIGLGVALKSLGIDSVMAKVGDRYVLEEMQAHGASIGGEDSGHLLFLQHHTTGDGIITALQVAAAMKKEGKPLSELAEGHASLPPGSAQHRGPLSAGDRDGARDHGRHRRGGAAVGGPGPGPGPLFGHPEPLPGDGGGTVSGRDGGPLSKDYGGRGQSPQRLSRNARDHTSPGSPSRSFRDSAANADMGLISILQKSRFFPIHTPGQRLCHNLLPVRLHAQADAAVRADLARNGNQLVGNAPRQEDLLRLQDMADRGKQKNDIGRRFHQGRTSRAAPAIVSRMSYILEMRPAPI